MSRRFPIVVLASLLILAGCTNKKVSNPIANVDSKQPDKVLFDRAMDAMKHNRFDVARLTLQTLINTYPDSEFIARAKLAIADSWYGEGGSASLSEAEVQYKDFITFFPNMPEAAEAQLKIANIHYQQMEKPDRDYTHAMRAEEEYRQLIMQFPDSKLVPQAKQRLREVQEVIAEREYRVGRFYYMRQSYPASIARLKSLADKYPLYSKADETLYLLGQAYEGEINALRLRPTCSGTLGKPPGCLLEGSKAAMISEFTKGAADAYDRIITRYPLMDRADDARLRLAALKQPIPRPTKAEVAQNRAEEEGRKDPSTISKVVRAFEKHPDTAVASKVGEPTLVDPTPMNASDVVNAANRAAMSGATGGSQSVSVETVGTGAPAADQAAPRSDAPAADQPNSNAASPDSSTTPSDASAQPASAQPGSGDSAPAAAADPNELKPNVPGDAQALPPPQQVNQIQSPPSDAQAPSTSGAAAPSASSNGSTNSADPEATDADMASSKPKKKKGIHKIIPF
jgi:outer membrane protein assembly factor BamD